MRILLIDGEKTTQQRLAARFAENQVIVDCEGTAEGARAAEKTRHYDGVIFGLPQLKDATQFFVPTLRRPVLILSSDQTVASKVAMLQAGVDDYVTKPFFVDEVMARMRALVRRYNGHTFSTLEAGLVQLDIDSHQVRVGGELVHFQPLEYKILECLMLRRGRTVTKDAVLDYIYGGASEPMVKIIDVVLCRVRKKIKAAGWMIETVWGRGWRIPAPASGGQA